MGTKAGASKQESHDWLGHLSLLCSTFLEKLFPFPRPHFLQLEKKVLSSVVGGAEAER